MSAAHAAIPRPYLSLLSQLVDEGGSADLDRHGRLTVGPTRAPIPGGATEWLFLVGQGLVAGEAGKIIATQEGRDLAISYLNGRTPTAV